MGNLHCLNATQTRTITSISMEAEMTWTEMITIRADKTLDKKEVIDMFYGLGTRPGKDLVDTALLCNPATSGDFCIRLTWQGEIPARGKSDFGAKLEEAFSKMGKAGHTVWQREGSLVFMNPEPIYPMIEKKMASAGVS